jgi:large subunit ribosomal protein L13
VEKTYVIKGEVETKWVLFDAAGQKLGRMATKIATILIGKHKPNYTPGVAMGDSVIVINAEKVQVNPTRARDKVYYRHSNYPGGLKAVKYARMLEVNPDRIIRFAVKGMLPRNKIGRKLLGRLRVYAGPDHPHKGQNPEKME